MTTSPHPTFDELENRWMSATPLPIDRGILHYIVRRSGDTGHESLQQASISIDHGLEGDRWRTDDGKVDTNRDRQVSLITRRVFELVGGCIAPLHSPGNNLVVDFDLSVANLPVGAQFQIGEAILEVSPEPHLGCKIFHQRFGADALRWVNHKGHRARRLRGVYARVQKGAQIRTGDQIGLL